MMPEFQESPLQDNEAVEFDVQADDHGRAHAVALKPVLGRKPHGCLGQRHRGYVRRFADRWGFLNAAAFDGDLFVHRDNLLPVPEHLTDRQPPLCAGQAVEFDVALDDRGRAVAKQITTRALMRPCDWIGHRLRGYIRSFQGAWGFINSDRFAGDLFVHRDSLLAHCQTAQLAVGTVVEFDIERDHHRKGSKNRLVARHVATLGGGDGTVPASGWGDPHAQQSVAYATHALPGAYSQQASAPMDAIVGAYRVPSSPAAQPYPSLNPQAATFAPSQQHPAMYYTSQEGSQAGSYAPGQQPVMYYAPQEGAQPASFTAGQQQPVYYAQQEMGAMGYCAAGPYPFGQQQSPSPQHMGQQPAMQSSYQQPYPAQQQYPQPYQQTPYPPHPVSGAQVNGMS